METPNAEMLNVYTNVYTFLIKGKVSIFTFGGEEQVFYLSFQIPRFR